MPDWIEIWGSAGQNYEPSVMFLKSFMNYVCSVAGHNILLKEATAIK